MAEFPPEAPWVSDMKRHFAEHGFYRREDLERLLGKPGDSVSVSLNGDVVFLTQAQSTPSKEPQ